MMESLFLLLYLSYLNVAFTGHMVHWLATQQLLTIEVALFFLDCNFTLGLFMMISINYRNLFVFGAFLKYD